MSLLEISVGLVVVSILVGGIVIKYSGRADEARLVAELEAVFANRKDCSNTEDAEFGVEQQEFGWQEGVCYFKKSGIAEATYILPLDPSEKQRDLKALRRIGGHYNEEAQTVTFERVFVSRHSGRHRAFRYLLNNEGFAQ